MIMYSSDPMSLVSWEVRANLRIPLASGGHVEAEVLEGSRVRILSVCSTDPMDYLDLRYQPGNILNLDPAAGTLV